MAQPLFEPLWSAAQARAADAYTIEDIGVPGIVLMEHAGKAVADVARRRFPHLARAIVFAGPGNNGGDGWVIARHLWGAGIPCPVVTLRSPDALEGDASLAAQMFLAAAEARGWTCEALTSAGAFFLVDLADDVQQLLDATAPDVVIDAVFGTGLSRALDGVAARVVDGLSRSRVPILAVDLPSGLPTDGEAPLGACITAHATVTFSGKKIAHASEPGRSRCGDVDVVDIGMLVPASNPPAAWRLVDARMMQPSLDGDAFKNRYGHVAVLMGTSAGASRLAARASLRAGAGLASVVVDGPVERGLLEAELMTRAVPLVAGTGAAGSNPDPSVNANLSPSASGAAHPAPGIDDVDRALAGITALIAGPGLGHKNAERARAFLERAAAAKISCVVDAEAIDALAARAPAGIAGLRCVVTPHPGEAARALGGNVTSVDVQRDRIAALKGLKAKLGAGVVVVLKGSCPCILGDDGRVIVVEGGHPALAVAGSGDVLAGAIGGLLARGLDPYAAALVGVDAHQRAGKALSRGALAGEIADALPAALALAK